MRAIERSKLVWARITATGAGIFVPFPEQPDLTRGKALITGIESFTDEELAFVRDGTPVITAADAGNLTLTIQEFSDERHQDMPLLTLNTAITAGIWKEFDPFGVAWPKSGVFPVAAMTAEPLAAAFLVYYCRPGSVHAVR